MRQRGIVLRPGAVGAGGLVLLVLMTACSGGGSAGSTDRLATPEPGVASVAPVTPSGGSGTGAIAPTEGPEGAVGRVALRAYQSWWDAKIKAFADADSDGSQLSAYSSGQALSDSLASLHQLHEAKLVMVGTPRTSAVVKKLDLKANPQTAEIEDCLDVSEWHQADAVTQVVKDPPQRLSRYLSTTRLRKAGVGWIIVEVTREVGQTC
ncbi:hypothetical protein GCM10010193_49100 [Kitasatospora atroaurantiaca]|uniref:Mce-associated membrane protein n=1 Tax=Kitasatospora atroaurantiaca TaxID=285545 RepID=A0A561EYN0_9ACTN|nr:hypothetical protein [Kitasatospora atroaurantiaca]TWE20712.1 hypothetical protein FB465_5870 [Kitasatospora atroaurantiaca]